MGKPAADFWPPKTISLSPSKRVLYLTKDLSLIHKQLYEGLTLKMADLSVDSLLDDINTDMMTPAWVCFDFDPQEIAKNAYAGLFYQGKRVFETGALMDNNFEVIVSGWRKGTGSSRETAAQCEKYSGIRIAVAASFAPIHERNNINLGQLMAGYDVLLRLEKGESVPLQEFTKKYDPVTRLIIESGGLFPFSKKLREGQLMAPWATQKKRPMTLVEKILAQKISSDNNETIYVKAGDILWAKVDGGYSHEFTSAQVHTFLKEEFGENYKLFSPKNFAVFEDHLVYATSVLKMAPFTKKIQALTDMQKAFQQQNDLQDFSAVNGISPGICHEVAREKIINPGDFIQATDSHTCMGGSLGAVCYGVGSTEYAALLYAGSTLVTVPESIRFELTGQLHPSCTAKDIMLYLLCTFARKQKTLNRAMEFAGPGLLQLSPDERATLCNMATECSAKTGICEADERVLQWIKEYRPDSRKELLQKNFLHADKDAVYEGGIHTLNLSQIKPMVAHPGKPDEGIPSDPTNGIAIDELDEISIDIAYGGSCTAGKLDDLYYYVKVIQEAVQNKKKVADGVVFYVQFASEFVLRQAEQKGWLQLFEQAGVIALNPGCGACIGCGPGVSENTSQITISAINRNYQGRSGPGRLYLASPLTVAASAFTGKITAFRPGMFTKSCYSNV